MSARIIGGLVYDLDDGPVVPEFGRSPFDGTPQQRLVLGEDSDKLSILLTATSIERIDVAIEALARIREVKIFQAQIKQMPGVA